MKRVQHLGPTLKATIKRFLMKPEKPKTAQPSVILPHKGELLEMLGNIVFTYVIRMKTSC
jgi:hypothetical protein